ncbi:MAG: sulfatase-like hydrolase/transferase [Candidatus Lokiarchaeota archaeon]|nr:sulfatase-like hydrolase/transferase [Candidatus Lokiarchaeota archaeon]MBD3338710.1 sulfatase-like hydrolase/transferase [Candidatus Lokiarchaeota archaeon]
MARRPNIVMLLNDHQAFYGHGRTSGGPKIQRPNFERLTNEGIEFTRAYTCCPLCAPARRSILTGVFPHAHGELNNTMFRAFERITYLDILANQGYDNYYYGKWHAGSGTAFDHQCEGFSYPDYSNPYTKPEYKAYLERNKLPEFEVEITQHFLNPNWKKTKELGIKVGTLHKVHSEWSTEHAIGDMTTPKETHEAFFLASLACERLKQINDSGNDNPFHLRVDFWGPHQPYYATKEYLDLYDPKSIPVHPNFHDDLENKPKIYQNDLNYPISKRGKLIKPNPLPWSEWQKVLQHAYAQITLVDHAGGLVLDALDQLGLSDNTFVIWLSDHGDGVACHGGHFNKDAYMPEELVRIPMAMRYPPKVSAGQKCERLVSNLDIPSTFLDIAGTNFDGETHSRSLLPLCFEGSQTGWKNDLMVETHGTFHLHVGRMVVTTQYKYIWNDEDLDELYDLKDDPYELNNLIKNPDYYEILEDMKKRLIEWRKHTKDNLTKKALKRRNRKKNRKGSR